MLILLATLFGTQGAWAISVKPPLRLIQYGENERAWLNEEQIQKLSDIQHDKGKCGGFIDITDFPNPPANLPIFSADLENFQPTQQKIVIPILSQLSAKFLFDTVKELSSFKNRYYQLDSGEKAAQWIKNRFIKLSQGRSDVSVELFAHQWKQPSVIARIQGHGPKASEIVVIGAHEDSINRAGQSGDAPGADDDASGVATVLAVFKALIENQYQPDRTLEFITYAAEEVGLKGSQDIAMRHSNQNKKVVGALQFDMTMYPAHSKVITMITDNADSTLTQVVRILIDEYVKTPWKNDTCGYACSDHASWTRMGYASAFPFEAPFDEYNRNIHTSKDTLDILDAEFGLHYSKIGVAFAIEMSSKN